MVSFELGKEIEKDVFFLSSNMLIIPGSWRVHKCQLPSTILFKAANLAIYLQSLKTDF